MAKASAGFRAMADRVLEKRSEVSRALYRAVEYGSEQMQEYILTRGTMKDWVHSWERSDGETAKYSTENPEERVDSGFMLNSVTHSPITQKGGIMTARGGWVDSQVSYFLKQENGFKALNTIKATGYYTVEGMFALRDATQDAKDFMEKEMTKIVKEGF